LVISDKVAGSRVRDLVEDGALPGAVQLTKSFSTSLGIGWRDPAERFIEEYNDSPQRGGYNRLSCGARVASGSSTSQTSVRTTDREIRPRHKALNIPEAQGQLRLSCALWANRLSLSCPLCTWAPRTAP
jgi:hypothetical protein